MHNNWKYYLVPNMNKKVTQLHNEQFQFEK